MMKFGRIGLVIAVILLAAMGDRAGDAGDPSAFVRHKIGEDSAPSPVSQPAIEGALEVLDAASVDPGAFRWLARPVIVFADSPQDPNFRDQMRMLSDDPVPLLIRDVVVIADADPGALSAWRRDLRPEGFTVVLMDKDGQIKLRKPTTQSVRELSRSIDKSPLRRQEVGQGTGQK